MDSASAKAILPKPRRRSIRRPPARAARSPATSITKNTLAPTAATRRAVRISDGIVVWPNRDLLQEIGGMNLYAFVANEPITSHDVYGMICDKCIKGHIRYVHATDWGLVPTISHGNPNSVPAAMEALNGAKWVENLDDLGEVAKGLAVLKYVGEVAELEKSLTKIGINRGVHWGWDDKMVDAIREIQNLFKHQEGVFIDVQISWQLCQESYFFTSHPDQVIPGTKHLDWVSHSHWYINRSAGKSGPANIGFNINDTRGISKALTPSIFAAFKNTDYEHPQE